MESDIHRRYMTKDEKQCLDNLVSVVRDYLERYHKPILSRHYKTTFVFSGDRYKPILIDPHFRKAKPKPKKK